MDSLSLASRSSNRWEALETEAWVSGWLGQMGRRRAGPGCEDELRAAWPRFSLAADAPSLCDYRRPARVDSNRTVPLMVAGGHVGRFAMRMMRMSACRGWASRARK